MSVRARLAALEALVFALRAASYVLYVAAGYYLVLGALELAPRLAGATSMADLAPLLRSYLVLPAALALAGVLVGAVAGLIAEHVDRAREEFIRRLIGLVDERGAVSLGELAEALGESPRYIEELLHQLRGAGRFHGYVDKSGIVYSRMIEAPQVTPRAAAPRQEVQQPRPPVQPATPIHETPGPVAEAAPALEQAPEEAGEQPTVTAPEAASSAPAPHPPSARSGGGLEEKRRRIEEMYRRGLISRETYLKMLEELEREAGSG